MSPLLILMSFLGKWSPVQDLNPHTAVRSRMFYPVRLTGDKVVWVVGFEPTKCEGRSSVPYPLGYTHIKANCHIIISYL